ncbi:MAG: hypothetical protein D6694_07090, partial [Gammaproteobacteria bacterium]
MGVVALLVTGSIENGTLPALERALPDRPQATTLIQTKGPKIVKRSEHKPPVPPVDKAKHSSEFGKIARCQDASEINPEALFDGFKPAVARLLAADDPRRQEVGLLLLSLVNNTDKDEQWLPRLHHFLSAHPESSLLARHYMAACVEFPDRPECEAGTLMKLTKSFQASADFWLMLAMRNIRLGDENGVYEALREAIAAQAFFRMSHEATVRLRHALTELGLAPHEQFFLVYQLYNHQSFGAFENGWRELFDFCRRAAQRSASGLTLCLEWSERLINDGPTDFGRLLGFGLQREIYKALGDQEAVERLNKMHKNLSDEENDFYTSVGV